METIISFIKSFDIISPRPMDKLHFMGGNNRKSTFGGIISILVIIIIGIAAWTKWD